MGLLQQRCGSNPPAVCNNLTYSVEFYAVKLLNKKTRQRFFIRSRGDSNPRYPFGAQLLSREPDSASLAPLQRVQLFIAVIFLIIPMYFRNTDFIRYFLVPVFEQAGGFGVPVANILFAPSTPASALPGASMRRVLFMQGFALGLLQQRYGSNPPTVCNNLIYSVEFYAVKLLNKKNAPAFFLSGAGGIRTPGTLRHNGFQDRLLQPLGHRSKDVYLFKHKLRAFVQYGNDSRISRSGQARFLSANLTTLENSLFLQYI